MTITDALAGSTYTGAAVWFAPAGTDPREMGEWRELGSLDFFRAEPIHDDDGGAYDFDVEQLTAAMQDLTLTVTWTAGSLDAFMAAMLWRVDRQPGWTARQYRAARRQSARWRRAARRAQR